MVGGVELGRDPSPRTPSLPVPQLSYNTVSACNRLLCELRKEDEKLVSLQGHPDPTQTGERRDLGGVCLSFSPWFLPSVLQLPCFECETPSIVGMR